MNNKSFSRDHEKDTISRYDLINALKDVCNSLYMNIEQGATLPTKEWFDGMKYAISIANRIYPVAPEIIRCEDCKYYHPTYCKVWSKFGTVQTRPSGYCYMAERRG